MVAALAYIQMRDAIGPNPRGFTAIGVFLFFGAVMASLAATTLLWRGTVLDRLWTLNPTAYKQLAPLGRIVGILFLALSAALITAGIGWFQRRLWGWRLAVVIISTQVVGDVVNCVRGDWLRGGTGIIIAMSFSSTSVSRSGAGGVIRTPMVIIPTDIRTGITAAAITEGVTTATPVTVTTTVTRTATATVRA